MITELASSEFNAVLSVINEAAEAYRDVIPEDCWKEPYMTINELVEDIESGIQFYGYIQKHKLLGVMGIQPVRDVTLIRHAYVLPNWQRKGIGKNLLNYLLPLAQTQEILVGTWAMAHWAVSFYQKNGFEILLHEGQNLLRQYWKIPVRQAESSMVLRLKI